MGTLANLIPHYSLMVSYSPKGEELTSIASSIEGGNGVDCY